jgi:sulfofructose kinase
VSPEPPRFDVLGLGAVAIDDLLYVDAYPPPDSKVRVHRRERRCGGLTATALIAAARLGARCAYAGVLGSDEPSRLVADAMEREGIDLSFALRREGASPAHSTIVVGDGGRTRTVFAARPGLVGADPAWPEEDVIRATRALFVDHVGVEGMIRAARVARGAGIPVVADFERDDEPRFPELLALADHLIISQAFAARLTGEVDPARAAARLAADGRAAVVVTCGARGCWSWSPSEADAPRHHPAFAVTAVDTTGCGDVFHGAYAATLARGADLPERLRLASAAAALKAMRSGGPAGIPGRAEVETFLGEVGRA